MCSSFPFDFRGCDFGFDFINSLSLSLYSLNICIRFNQNIDERSYISTKIEAVEHLYGGFLLKAASTVNQIVESFALF